MITQCTAQRTKKRALRIDPLAVRVQLLVSGESMRAWSRRHHHNHNTVWQAIYKGRVGAKSNQIIQELREDLGI